MNIISDIHAYIRRSRHGYVESDYTYRSKKYSRMPQIELAAPNQLDMRLVDALAQRRSMHENTYLHASRDTLGQLFGHALKVRSDKRRPYPSGGGFYPIETYFLSFGVDELDRGVFHYRPDTHALEHLWDLEDKKKMADFTHQDMFKECSGLIIFTAVWKTSAQKYKDFAYNLALLEAGHMGQNILLVGGTLKLGMRPLGGFNDDIIIETLDIDPRHEQPVYVIVIT